MNQKEEIFVYILLSLWVGYLFGQYFSIKSDFTVWVGLSFLALAALGAYFSGRK